MRWQGAPFRTSGLLMLLGVNAGLVGWIWSLAASNNATRIDSSRWTVNWSDIGAKVTNQKPLDSYQRILAHPVFFRSRESSFLHHLRHGRLQEHHRQSFWLILALRSAA